MTVVLFSLLRFTAPDEIGPIGVTLFFIGLYGWFVLSLQLLLKAMGVTTRDEKATISNTAWMGGFVPVIGLALVSLDQLGAREIALICTVIVLVWFYARRRLRN